MNPRLILVKVRQVVCQEMLSFLPRDSPSRSVFSKMRNMMTRLRMRMLKKSGLMRSPPRFMPVKLLSANP